MLVLYSETRVQKKRYLIRHKEETLFRNTRHHYFRKPKTSKDFFAMGEDIERERRWEKENEFREYRLVS